MSSQEGKQFPFSTYKTDNLLENTSALSLPAFSGFLETT